MITRNDIDNWFTYHDDPNKVPKYKAIREAAKYLANVIVDHTPTGADQSAAIRSLREAVMTANAAIACEVPQLMGFTDTNANYGTGHQAGMKATEDPYVVIAQLRKQLDELRYNSERIR